MQIRKFLTAAISLGATLALPAVSYAQSYDAEYVFGNSLSDTGNAAELNPNVSFPDPPSYHYSFSNGPVAVQVIASDLGLNANPSLFVTNFQDVNNLFGGSSYTPGTNYAVAGATATASPPQGGIPNANLPQQVSAYLSANAGKADPKALYTVFIGSNDVSGAALYGNPAEVTTGVTSEIQAIQALSAAGARNFLVPNVWNIGNIPEYTQDNPGLAALATQYSQNYNTMLSAGLAGLTLPQGTNLTPFDLYGYTAEILANAASLGFTDTTDPCFTMTPSSAMASPQCGPNGQNVNSFIYWDSIHPTATVQALWAQAMLDALEGGSNPSLVPEPATLALLGAGLLGVAGLRRRRA